MRPSAKRKVAPKYDAGTLDQMASAPKKPVKTGTGLGRGRGKSKAQAKAKAEERESDQEVQSECPSEHGGSDAGTAQSSNRLNDVMAALDGDDDLLQIAQDHCKYNKKAGIKCLVKLNVESFLYETKLGQVIQGVR